MHVMQGMHNFTCSMNIVLTAEYMGWISLSCLLCFGPQKGEKTYSSRSANNTIFLGCRTYLVLELEIPQH
jgi:hypothetical protein